MRYLYWWLRGYSRDTGFKGFPFTSSYLLMYTGPRLSIGSPTPLNVRPKDFLWYTLIPLDDPYNFVFLYLSLPSHLFLRTPEWWHVLLQFQQLYPYVLSHYLEGLIPFLQWNILYMIQCNKRAGFHLNPNNCKLLKFSSLIGLTLKSRINLSCMYLMCWVLFGTSWFHLDNFIKYTPCLYRRDTGICWTYGVHACLR